METLTYTGRLVITTCWCGIPHAIPADLMREARDNRKGVFCPLGHEWVFGENRADKLARQLKEERARTALAVKSAQATRDLLIHEERSHAAARGHQAYRHELEIEDHADLVERVQTLAANVLISGYPHDLYDGPLEQAGFERFTFHRHSTASAALHGRGDRTEVVWRKLAHGAQERLS